MSERSFVFIHSRSPVHLDHPKHPPNPGKIVSHETCHWFPKGTKQCLMFSSLGLLSVCALLIQGLLHLHPAHVIVLATYFPTTAGEC